MKYKSKARKNWDFWKAALYFGYEAAVQMDKEVDELYEAGAAIDLYEEAMAKAMKSGKAKP